VVDAGLFVANALETPQQTISHSATHQSYFQHNLNKKVSYCWETVRCESMPRIAEMDVEMTT